MPLFGSYPSHTCIISLHPALTLFFELLRQAFVEQVTFCEVGIFANNDWHLGASRYTDWN